MITQLLAHPALDAVYEGIRLELENQGFTKENLKITFKNAHGNTVTASQIARNFAGENPDVVVGISTPSAQAIASSVKGKIPLVFSAVTDPYAANLVHKSDGEKNKKRNVTGVTGLFPFKKQIKFIKEILPNTKKIGVIYNPGEDNSVASLQYIKDVSRELGIEIVESVATKSVDVSSAAQKLVGKIDAIFVPTDNTVVSSLKSVIKVGKRYNIPVFAADIMLVEQGLVGMVGVDYKMMGYQTGKLIARILRGENTSSIPVEHPIGEKMILNQEVAKTNKIIFSQKILSEAAQIIESKSKK